MIDAKTLLTPKELAEAIGASESSVRRWVDGGDIRISRTAGGHRRIMLPDAISFIRKMGATIVRPDVLGLSDLSTARFAASQLSDDQKLFDALEHGDTATAKSLIISWYLDGRNLPQLFDGPIRSAFERMGELWKHDPRAILIEHRATEITIEALAMLRNMLPAADAQAPLALGGAPSGDPYQLPSLMVSTVLADAGFREINFGANVPVELLASEAVARGAKLVWLSLSAPQEAKALLAMIKQAAEKLAEHKIQLLIGGRHHTDYAPRGLTNVSFINSMSELAAFARGAKSSDPK